MAFTGAAVVAALGRNMVRITGVSLAGNTAGTIGLVGGGADISLPTSFPSAADAGALANGLTYADLVELRYTIGVVAGPEQDSVHVDKNAGANPFPITITNDQGQNTGGIEFYIQYHHSIHR